MTFLRKTAVSIVIFLISCSSAVAAATEPRDTWTQFADFAATRTFTGRVVKIEHDMRGSLSDTFVRGIPDFHRLADRRYGNIGDCLAFLADPATTNRQKYFAVLTLYGLYEHGYGVFLSGLAKLAQSAAINDRVILTAIRQQGFTDVVIDNYQRSEIRQPLLALLSAPGVSAKGKGWIEDVLSGKFYFRKLGIGSPPTFTYPLTLVRPPPMERTLFTRQHTPNMLVRTIRQ